MNLTNHIETMMKQAYDLTDRDWLMTHTEELWKIERGQTFGAYARSADYTYNLLKENGFEAELLTFPADGKTVYQDKRMPLAWDASMGRLTVVKSPIVFEDPVVADFEKMPFALVKHSVSTPEGGLRVPLVTEAQVLAGADCTGAMVLLEPETDLRPRVITPHLNKGALGFVSEYLVGCKETPDAVEWVTAGTEGENWHVQCEDRDFIAYSVSPRTGAKLRKAALTGPVEVLVESDGRRYEGEIHAVTGLLPGKQKKELWILSHLYEPLSDDNSAGVIASIGLLKIIREMTERGLIPPLEFSIRVVFAMEVYGFAAVAEHFGGYLGDRAMGGVNTDGLNVIKSEKAFTNIYFSPLCSPFYGNFVMKSAMDAYIKIWGNKAIREARTMPGDDTYLSDPTTGLPTLWPLKGGRGYWHNSAQDMDYISEEAFARTLSLVTAWAAGVVTLNQENLPMYLESALSDAQAFLEMEAKSDTRIGTREEKSEFFYRQVKLALENFALVGAHPLIDKVAAKLQMPELTPREESVLETSWLDFAEYLVPSRTHRGLPHDLVKFPKEERKGIVDGVLYGPVMFILFGMDGKKTLRQLLCEAIWEQRREVNSGKIKSYINAILYLAEGGYVKVENRANTRD